MNIEQGPLNCHTLSRVQRGGSLQQTSVVLRFDMWTPCGHKKKDLSLHQLLEKPWGEKIRGLLNPGKVLAKKAFWCLSCSGHFGHVVNSNFYEQNSEGRQPWVCNIGRFFLGNWLSSLVRQCNYFGWSGLSSVTIFTEICFYRENQRKNKSQSKPTEIGSTGKQRPRIPVATAPFYVVGDLASR